MPPWSLNAFDALDSPLKPTSTNCHTNPCLDSICCCTLPRVILGHIQLLQNEEHVFVDKLRLCIRHSLKEDTSWLCESNHGVIAQIVGNVASQSSNQCNYLLSPISLDSCCFGQLISLRKFLADVTEHGNLISDFWSHLCHIRLLCEWHDWWLQHCFVEFVKLVFLDACYLFLNVYR